jgi:hypothetical protein
MSTAEGGGDIVRDGLVLLLDAANPRSYLSGSTTWTDLSGNENNGTLINGPTFNSGNGGSIVFDGVNDYVSMNNKNPPSINSTFLNGLTIGFIIKLTDPFPITFDGRTILTRNSGGIGSNAFNLSIQSNRKLRFWINNTSTLPFSNTTLNTNQIYIGSLVLNRTTNITSFYLQGVLDSNTNYSPSLSTSTHTIFNIGYWGAPSWEFPGNIYNISFYNRALSATEISQNFNATRSRFGI